MQLPVGPALPDQLPSIEMASRQSSFLSLRLGKSGKLAGRYSISSSARNRNDSGMTGGRAGSARRPYPELLSRQGEVRDLSQRRARADPTPWLGWEERL